MTNCTFCGSTLPQGAMFCGVCGRSVNVTRATLTPPKSAPIDDIPEPEREPEPKPDAQAEPEPEPEAEPEPVAQPEPEPEPVPEFSLQFSTGESVAVMGTGLVGRNPSAEPGEYFDTLIAIVDPGKSVSKTHLEFGHEDGVFWISDRFSGNGSALRLPATERVQCGAGKRYRVPRGGRVDMGDQFFVVS